MTAVAAPRRRTAGAWAAIVAGVVALGIAAAAIGAVVRAPAFGLLEPDAATPEGARALVHVLRDHGVDVDVAGSLADAERATRTLAVASTAPLSDEALERLAAQVAAHGGDLVLLDPSSRDLRVLLGGASIDGLGDEPVGPACDLPEARRAGEVAPGIVFAPGDEPGTGVTACYPAASGGYGLLVRETDGIRVVALDATSLFTNATLADRGNAALAANLLGRTSALTWYVPSLADSDLEGDVTLGELTPGWVTPAMVLLVLAAAVAGVWRGRRFGPLVAETLPVTVRAEETTLGRARLYQRGSERTHALDRLRLGALDRLATRLGLGPAASVDEIADAVAARTGADRSSVRAVLRDATPGTDRELVDLAEALRTLDDAVAATLHPERKTP